MPLFTYNDHFPNPTNPLLTTTTISFAPHPLPPAPAPQSPIRRDPGQRPSLDNLQSLPWENYDKPTPLDPNCRPPIRNPLSNVKATTRNEIDQASPCPFTTPTLHDFHESHESNNPKIPRNVPPVSVHRQMRHSPAHHNPDLMLPSHQVST